MRISAVLMGLCLGLGIVGASRADGAEPVHAIAMHGQPKYPAGFSHFDYVNPDAPKGGTVRLAAMGGFDTVNPYTIRGVAATGLTVTYDTLLVASADEPFSAYGLVAESLQFPEDRSEVTFTLRPEARWSDGTPISADDVVFSLETLRTKGLPFFNAYYADVQEAKAISPRQVRFVFKVANNRELPLIIGQMPLLPKHYWQGRDFEAVTLEAPVSSGPYAIETLEAGRSISYRRRADYWANDLPAVRGQYNFDRIVYAYYRDATVMLEAFKAGAFDFRWENVARQWAGGYESPALKDGRIVMKEFPHHRVAGMQGFAFNLRRPVFQDPRVREALAYTFDFDWTNRTLFHNSYKRMRSFFDNSDLTATGLPSAAELALLEPLRDKIPARVFTDAYEPPAVTEAGGGLRGNLGKATALLKQAGWEARDGVLRNAAGEPFAFEILLLQPEFDRIVVPMVRNMERLGIRATIRTVDSAQYLERLQNFQFDMIVEGWPQSESPGNEQRDFWSSAAAATPGSRNTAGLQSEAVDALIERIVTAETREDLVTRVRALDRVLQWSFIAIPQYYLAADRVAYWNMFGMPDALPEKGYQFFTWWVDEDKLGVLRGRAR